MRRPSADDTGGNSRRPHMTVPKTKPNKENNSVNAEMSARATAPTLADSFQYHWLFRVTYHKATAIAADNPAHRSSRNRNVMTAQDNTPMLKEAPGYITGLATNQALERIVVNSAGIEPE